MVRDEEACYGEHVAVRVPLVSEFSASTVWVPGAKLRLGGKRLHPLSLLIS